MTASVGPAADFDTWRSEWSALALVHGSIFGTPEWAETWWAEYGRDRQPELLPVTSRDGGLMAIVPLYVQRRGPLRLARFIGHGAGDELGPICAPSDRAAVARALTEAWRDGRPAADVLLAEALPEVDGWHASLGGSVVRRESSPTTHFVGRDWAGYMATLSANARSQLGRRERRLVGQHGARYRTTTDEATLEQDLDMFFRLHRARWGSASSLTRREAVFRRFASVALARDWLRLAFLEVDGAAIATSLDFIYAGTQFQYNAGRDPAWDASSCGLVLRCMVMRQALEDGVSEYRFLRGDEAYKDRFATSDRGSLTLALPRTWLGRLALGGSSVLTHFKVGRRVLVRAVRG